MSGSKWSVMTFRKSLVLATVVEKKAFDEFADVGIVAGAEVVVFVNRSLKL